MKSPRFVAALARENQARFGTPTSGNLPATGGILPTNPEFCPIGSGHLASFQIAIFEANKLSLALNVHSKQQSELKDQSHQSLLVIYNLPISLALQAILK